MSVPFGLCLRPIRCCPYRSIRFSLRVPFHSVLVTLRRILVIPKPRRHTKEVKDPEPFTGIQTDLKRFNNQLALVLADVGRFTDVQYELRYCFSLLNGDAYTIMEPYVSPSGVAFPDIEAFLKEITRLFGDSDEKATAARELEKLK